MIELARFLLYFLIRRPPYSSIENEIPFCRGSVRHLG
jgi:hypothetical protein